MAAAAAILATAVLSGRDDVRGRGVGLDDPAELPNYCLLASADWESKAIVSTRAQQTEDTRQQPPPWPMPLPCTSPLPDSTADANFVAVAANTITYVASHVPRRQTSLAPDRFVVSDAILGCIPWAPGFARKDLHHMWQLSILST